jgi:exoribonuclease-2
VHLLYEEDGELKAGTVLERSPASFHVESPHGRRSKVKAGHVLLSFEQPPPAELLGAAASFADDLDISFLWECKIGRAHV